MNSLTTDPPGVISDALVKRHPLLLVRVATLIFCFLLLSYLPAYSQGEVLEKTITVDGFERQYLLYVPSDYTGEEEWPLVFNFHGYTSSAPGQMRITQMNEVAEQEHFLVAYPQGLSVNIPSAVVPGPGPGWYIPVDGIEREEEQDDLAFVNALIDQLDESYTIDVSRIHATGWSMGGHFSYYLACALSDRIASVGAVGGPIPEALISDCDARRPYSTLLIHGTADPIVSYEGFPGFIASAEAHTEFWASLNHCDQEPTVTDLPDINTEDGSTATKIEYSGCNKDSEVILYRMNNDGHTWPGGGFLPPFLGNINRDINASQVIWDFFERNPMPDLVSGGTGKLEEYSFMHDGIERNYWLYVPEDYDGQEDWPLVMVFHGFQIDGRFQMEVSQMNPVADKEKFLIAYPEGLPVLYPLTGESGPGWIIPGAFEREEHQDDVGFASKVIDDVDDKYNIDLARIHSTGWSNGSLFSFQLACELSDRIASAGGVGGHMTYEQLSSCSAERPVSTILIHGTDDILVPFDGIPDLYPPVPTTPEYWVSQNNCSTEPTVTDLPDINTEDNSTITRYQYTGCDRETEMDFYIMNDGGHTWPQGGWPESEVWGDVWPEFLGPVNQDINAGQVIWDFFERNPFPTPFINQLTLVNAKTDEDIQPLQDGDVLDLSEIPRAHLNIRADVLGVVQSVKFELDGAEVGIENFEPYAMFGDQNGDYRSQRFRPGQFTLKVTPYTAPNAEGDPGEPLEVSLRVVRRNSLADVVRRTPEFSALLRSLRRSGLLSTFVGEGPYTVFAPKDEAFARLLDDLGVKRLNQIPVRELQQILKYHVVGDSELRSADLTDGTKLNTLSDAELMVTVENDKLLINDIEILEPDILASNGVIHVVDEVLLPPKELYNIMDWLAQKPDYSILLQAVELSGLSAQIREGNSLTLFAPNDVAFQKLFNVFRLQSIEELPGFMLRKVLLYHLLRDEVYTADIADEQELSSALGIPLSLIRSRNKIFVNNAYITQADQAATNGVIHAVSDIILPDANALLFGLEAFLDGEDGVPISAEGAPALQIFATPNPGARKVTIATQGMKGKELIVNVVDYSGLKTKKVAFEVGQTEEANVVDLTDFSSGMYIIHAQVGHLKQSLKVVR